MRVLAVVLALCSLATLAEARAGGGLSSGSRGSRSYSAPRSPSVPSSPMTPAVPTSPQRSLSPTPGTPSPAGRFGWGGMIGGFLLGGLLGGLLFGGLGGHGFGGVGLLDILLVGGLVWLAFAFFARRRQPEVEYAGTAGLVGTEPVEPVMVPAAAAIDEDIERGIAAIRAMDPGFTPLRFAGLARDVFVRVQAAWTARDLGPVRSELTDEMAGSLEADLARLQAARRVNRLDKLTVESAEPTEAWQESGRDFVTIRLRASVLDYTVDEATGAVVDGSQTVPAAFEEYWTFARPVGPNPWRLSAIQQPGG